MSALDAWIAARPDPKPSRPEAIRRLLDDALTPTRHEHSLDDKIAIAERIVAETPVPKKPSPEKGLAMLKRGKAQAALAGLAAKKKKKSVASRG
jgi:hypothetical protein